MRTLIVFVVACLILTSGCTSNASKTAEKGLFRIKLSAEGQLLKYGRNELDIHVTDNKGLDLEGATIEITPWMPEHGHGTAWPPTVIEKGRGRYRAIVPLLMTGHWQLKVLIRKGNAEDTTVFDFPNVTKQGG